MDDALCAIGRVEPDLGSYLDEWLRFEHPNAGTNLSGFFELNAADIARGELCNPFWGDDEEPASSNRDAIVAWAAASSTRDAVVAAVGRARTPEEAASLTRCLASWSAVHRNDPLC